jgi:hypothetical protein
VGRSTIRIGGGESPGGNDAVADSLAAEGLKPDGQLVDGDGAARAGDASVRQVGQNPQVDLPARDVFDLRGEFFASRVDGVCAHRITYVINQVDDDERSDG